MNPKEPFYVTKQRMEKNPVVIGGGALVGALIIGLFVFGGLSLDAWVAKLAWNAFVVPVFNLPILTFFQVFFLQLALGIFKGSPSRILIDAYSRALRKKA